MWLGIGYLIQRVLSWFRLGFEALFLFFLYRVNGKPTLNLQTTPLWMDEILHSAPFRIPGVIVPLQMPINVSTRVSEVVRTDFVHPQHGNPSLYNIPGFHCPTLSFWDSTWDVGEESRHVGVCGGVLVTNAVTVCLNKRTNRQTVVSDLLLVRAHCSQDNWREVSWPVSTSSEKL